MRGKSFTDKVVENNAFTISFLLYQIKKINCRRGHQNALLEYFDYPDESMFSDVLVSAFKQFSILIMPTHDNTE